LARQKARSVGDVLDNSYVEAALKIVGPYTPA
jgi:hypothetical protein